MSPVSFFAAPIQHLWNAVAKPFQALFVVGLCYFINKMTNPGNPWWHWVAFGMTIAVLVAWARAFKVIVLAVVVLYVGRWIYRKYGDTAKTRFDEWVSGRAATSGATVTPQPQAPKDVLQLIGNDAAVRAAGIMH